MEKIEQKIKNLVKKNIEELGYSIYDVQYVKEGKDYYLRIFIEKESGKIDLNDCEKVNNSIVDLLDEADIIKEQYFLEVSSTGVERLIRDDIHLQKHINENISIKLFKPLNGKKEYIGKLIAFNENEIKINTENKDIVINRKDISLMKKYYEW